MILCKEHFDFILLKTDADIYRLSKCFEHFFIDREGYPSRIFVSEIQAIIAGADITELFSYDWDNAPVIWDQPSIDELSFYKIDYIKAYEKFKNIEMFL